MSGLLVVPIVEGQGEQDALPALLFRIRNEIAPELDLRVNPPNRVKADQFLRFEREFERDVALVAAKARQSSRAVVLVLLDCEDHCPAKLGPAIRRELDRTAGDVRHLVVLARREYETWFLAAAVSLQGQGGLPDALAAPADPERIRGAKEWLGSQMNSRRYDPLRHQRLFSQIFDLDAACSVPSFARFIAKMREIMLEK